jgi:hypothetical protein
MTALVIREWDVPKEEDRLKKYYTPAEVTWEDFMMKYKVKVSQWTQGVGHQVYLEEFASLEEFAKAWSDNEYKRRWTLGLRNSDNATCRVLRSSMRVPPK